MNKMGMLGIGQSRMTSMPLNKSAACSSGNIVTKEHRRIALLELSVGYGLILLAVWTPQPGQSVVNLAALAWVMLVTRNSFDGLSAMGLRVSGALRPLWVVGAALLLAAAAVTMADRFHTLHLPGNSVMFIKRYWGYAIWAFLQEFLLLDFVLLRLLRLLSGRKAAVLWAAGLFAFAHLPNPILTPMTLLWGVASCLLFLRYRSIYSLAVAHAVFGICIATTVPATVTHSMKVGLGYLTYRAPAHLQRGLKAEPSGVHFPPAL